MQLIGSYRLAMMSDTVFVRFSNIVDARIVFAMLRGAFAELIVEYVSATDFNQVSSIRPKTFCRSRQKEVAIFLIAKSIGLRDRVSFANH
jgi:hypothetical protein